MGSSDPLPAEFEIRFGSLNFQATGNGYLMSSTRGGRLGQARFPPRLLLTPRRPLKWMLRALRHLDADDALASVRARHEWNDDGPRHGATCPPAR
jgi:hypothetical protein